MNQHNQQINKILHGCGNKIDGIGYVLCEDIVTENGIPQDKYFYCDNCKSLLKGILLAQENEIEWLENISKDNTKVFNFPDTFNKRLQALKLSNIKLREITK